MSPAARKRALTLAKLAFGIGLLIVLVTRVPLAEFRESFRSVEPLYLALLVFLPFPLQAVSTFRWRILLRALGLRVAFARLFTLYLIARFFSNFLPTMVGGDIVRAYQLSLDTCDASSTTAATVMERVIGLVALVSLLPVALLSDVIVTSFPLLRYAIPAFVLAFVAGLCGVFIWRWDLLWKRSRHPRIQRVLSFIVETRTAMLRATRSIAAVLHAYWLSLLFYVGSAGCVWAASKSLGVDVEMAYLMAVIPLVLLAATLPISLNGLGITEAGFAIFLELTGVPLADAIAVGLLLRVAVLLPAVIGGLLFLRHRSGNAGPSVETQSASNT